ncbi:MAG: BlaI/MecI/CopY family transcriptional regulator [Planctomycetales bacterium]|jgi:BlaI family penicillinase repressor
MPKKRDTPELARRERQIMDVIFQLGEATVGDVLERLPDPPSYSSVRTIIRKIESKGLLTHRQDGKRYVYRAKQSRETASRTALQKLMDVFFSGSAPDTVAAIMDVSAKTLDPEDLDRISKIIEQARKEGQ